MSPMVNMNMVAMDVVDMDVMDMDVMDMDMVDMDVVYLFRKLIKHHTILPRIRSPNGPDYRTLGLV